MSANVSTTHIAPNGDDETNGADGAAPLKPAAAKCLDTQPLHDLTNNILLTLAKQARLRKWWVKYSKKISPELLKVYGIIHGHLVEVQRLLALKEMKSAGSSAALESQYRSLLAPKTDELRDINIHAAWEYAGALERFLLTAGDEEYLYTRLLAEDRRERTSKLGAWSEYLACEKLAELLKDFKTRPVPPNSISRAREYLSYVYAGRIRYARHERAREELRASYLNRLTIFLTSLLFLLLLCIKLVESQRLNSVVTASVMGALGSTLSGFYKLRDEAGGITALRAFRSAMWAQPFVGAVVGVLLWFLLQSGMVTIGAGSSGGEPSWTKLSLLCFVAGFSEPFFLGLVQRVAGAADKAGGAPRKDEENKKAGDKI
ncbi:MAG TPA: hypothetical protein VJT74_04600 [Pyrinomonadaceae bacterium]|nr:hypothetical protein [Pyrinomonadaceae bacterium]